MQKNKFLDDNGSRYLLVSRALLTCFLIFISLSCADRDRINPIDPKNSDTDGRPENPVLLSFRDSVKISWRTFSFSDLEGYNLYRRLDGEDDYSFVAQAAPQADHYWDVGATFDLNRWYKITTRTANYESFKSDASKIRPGPTFVWAADIEDNQIIKYTHDGAHELIRAPVVLGPARITIDHKRERMWIADVIADQVVEMTLDGLLTETAFTVQFLETIAVDTVDGSVWTLSERTGTLSRYSASGEPILKRDGFDRPNRITVDQSNRTVYVLEERAGVLLQLDRDGRLLNRWRGLVAPTDIAINSSTGDIWIADSTAVVLISEKGSDSISEFRDFKNAFRVAVDEETGDCWVIDLSRAEGESKVAKLSVRGDIQFEITGFADPRAIAVNPFNSNCFVGESLGRRLVEISKTGEIYSRKNTPGAIVDIAIEFVKQ